MKTGFQPDGHPGILWIPTFKKDCFIFHMLLINCLFEKTLLHILDAHFQILAKRVCENAIFDSPS